MAHFPKSREGGWVEGGGETPLFRLADFASSVSSFQRSHSSAIPSLERRRRPPVAKREEGERDLVRYRKEGAIKTGPEKRREKRSWWKAQLRRAGKEKVFFRAQRNGENKRLLSSPLLLSTLCQMYGPFWFLAPGVCITIHSPKVRAFYMLKKLASIYLLSSVFLSTH